MGAESGKPSFRRTTRFVSSRVDSAREIRVSGLSNGKTEWANH